jgi:hypothetical protein
MLPHILRKFGVRLVLYKHSHNVLNATASIMGVLRKMIATEKMTKADFNDITAQLARIEKSLRYVRFANKGD